MPDRPGLRARISGRVFGGASGGVFRGMATLALGSGLGRLIGIASIPILTRLYSPEDFGVLAVFTALVAILAPLVTLRYALALPLPRHDGVAMNLLVLSTGLMLGLTGLFAVALWLFGAPLLALVSMQVLTPWWWLIALGVFGTAAYELLTMWATRKRAYKVIAQTNVTQSAAGALVKIGLGLASLQPLGLLVGQVVAQTGGVGRLISGFWAEMRANWRHVRASRMRKAAWRHRGFPVWRVPSQFFLTFSQKIIIGFFSYSYGAAVTGQLSIAFLSITLASNLIAVSLSKSFYGEIAQLSSMSEIFRTMTNMVLVLLVSAGSISTILFIYGQELTVIALGSQWSLAGSFVEITSIYLTFSLVAVSLSTVLNRLDMQQAYFILNVVRALVVAIVLGFSFHYKVSAETTLMVYALSMGALQSGTVVYYFYVVRKRTRSA